MRIGYRAEAFATQSKCQIIPQANQKAHQGQDLLLNCARRGYLFSIPSPHHNEHLEVQRATEPLKERLNNSDNSGYRLVAKSKDNVISSATLEKVPESNSSPSREWWLLGILVRWPYRGLGVGEKLTKAALG